MSGDDVTEPTAQQLRDAAATIRQMNQHPLYFPNMLWSPEALDLQAEYKETQQAEKAKRDKRVDSLSDEAIENIWPGNAFPPIREMYGVKAAVAYLVTTYPSLLDEDGER